MKSKVLALLIPALLAAGAAHAAPAASRAGIKSASTLLFIE